MLPRTWTLLKQTLNILLEGVPEGLDLESIGSALRSAQGVQDIHDLHVWALTSEMPSLSAHLVLADGSAPGQVRKAAQAMLRERFEITHVTLQTEVGDCREERQQHGFH
ncbi:MAG: hypothetical protein K2X43_12680 [Hyphomonadaceae bacterium]|nr:hypothetical protein [Hyphomonadaceae bacterium]